MTSSYVPGACLVPGCPGECANRLCAVLRPRADGPLARWHEAMAQAAAALARS